MQTNAHKMVAHLCHEMANTVYETLARDNEFYKANRNRPQFIRQHLAKNGVLYAKEARKILGTLLNDPELPIAAKDAIHEALSLDAAIRGNYDEKPVIPIL